MTRLPYRQVHLDFHTPALPFPLGENFDKAVFQERLLKAAVNSVTLTGRCHHGHIYYETALEARHPQLQNDFLMMEVDACHEVGIRAPIYLTAGWDAFVADRHPDWLERREDGSFYGFEEVGQLKAGWKSLCFNSPYLDYLKAQVIDCMQHFEGKLDGLFFDIVSQDPCLCNYCIEKMLGQGLNPEDLEDRKSFAKQTEFMLKAELTATIHELDEACPIFFNAGDIMPSMRESLPFYSHLEIESLPSGLWGYQHFPVAVRYAKHLGKDYLGMTGKFHKSWGDFGSYKNQAALEYECFLALAHGGKCSIGDQMYPDGSLQEATYDLIGSVYRQIESLETYNDGTRALADIAIIHTGISAEPSEKVDLSLAGAVNILSEAHHQFDIVDLAMDWSGYRLLIFPDKISWTTALEARLSAYLAEGGRVIASYQSGLNVDGAFPEAWGLQYLGKQAVSPLYWKRDEAFSRSIGTGEVVLHGPALDVETAGAEVLAEAYLPLFQRTYQHYYSHYQAPISDKKAAAFITKSEQVYYLSHPIFELYKRLGMREYRELILKLVDESLGGQIFKADLPATADFIVNHKEDEQALILNILHYIPQRKAVELDIIEEALPIRQAKISLSLKALSKAIGLELHGMKKIEAVRAGQQLAYRLEEERLSFELAEMKGYEIIVMHY